ncbi:DUF4832 domain-containing protein [Nannocystis radixulma]|uniref:DUF4832 domain-containing protein n=1 Tax=Nannocystis radixulma TaxID=2995305 RepID=A0ABT5BD37_9BACT|nr:DUF4832 domain-containing protein [Nannocystis radixulma]MDC0672064.1 DUF4832 domain-containing protein [Nannocystis radixulma]
MTSPTPRPLTLLLLGTLVAPACNGGGTATTDGATTDPTAGTTTDSTTAPTSSITTPDPTSSTTSSTTTSTTTPDPTSTTSTGPDPTGPDTDTGSEALACPIDANTPSIASISLTPALFGAGDDPSSSPACAIVNPERGFHGYVDLRDLDEGTLMGQAAAGRSVVYGQVLLPEYRDKPLDALVLDEVAAGFDLVRGAGMKVVPRFHYSDAMNEPDAELERILGHIEQLAPLLQEHADVILTLQAGFIGAWGEWHASQNGLDAPGPRKEILDALLAALPADRTVSVRRPSFKEEAYGGPLTADSAHDGSALSRVGHVNDCFLASDDDFGTYQEPGEKDYAITDSAFVPVGGETCAVNPPRSECPAALAELALHHWTHLNSAYHPDVLDSWQADGCYDEIACRLGYRLAVLALHWTESAVAGETVPVSLELVNDGFAAPVNPRPLVLVFQDAAGFSETVAEFDLRTLVPGQAVSLCVDVKVPANAPPGSYRIGLQLADPAPTLADDPRQAIRLANDTGVEWLDGINWFDATLSVQQ